MIGWKAMVKEGSGTSVRQAPHLTLALDIVAPYLDDPSDYIGSAHGFPRRVRAG
jgi:hypothetical protein